MKTEAPTHNEYGVSRGSLMSYSIGFGFSLVLTLAAFLLVKYPQFPREVLVFQILALGVGQLIIQLVFFLHLDRESSPRWNLAAFLFALSAVIFLVAGTLWIMKNLDYNMTPEQVEQQILEDEGIRY